MKTSYHIGKILGIKLYIHITWFFIFFLVVWSLATDFFPRNYPKLTSIIYWSFGIIAALLLFISVLFHELSHSLVAKNEKTKVKSITLFFFGGIANISPKKLTPISEIKMAIAGPISSLILAFTSFLISKFALFIIFDYLFKLNLVLAIFNLIPGYPLDGGRILRGLLWLWFNDIKKATRYASNLGKFFGYFLVFIGFLSMISLTGPGLWYILLGLFIVMIADASYKQVIIRELLAALRVKDVMDKEIRTINPTLSLKKFFELCLRTGRKSFLVNQNRIASFDSLTKIPKKYWPKLSVIRITKKVPILRPEQELFYGFEKLEEKNLNLAPVIKNKKVIGVLRYESIINLINLTLNEQK